MTVEMHVVRLSYPLYCGERWALRWWQGPYVTTPWWHGCIWIRS